MSLQYRCWLFGLLMGVALFTGLSESANAQQAPAPVQPSNSQPVGRSYYVEGGVVVALMAAAGFAVGRSSRRT